MLTATTWPAKRWTKTPSLPPGGSGSGGRAALEREPTELSCIGVACSVQPMARVLWQILAPERELGVVVVSTRASAEGDLCSRRIVPVAY